MENVTETLGQVLERQAALLPQKEFIVFPDRNLRFTVSGKIQKYKLRETGLTLLAERGAEVV
jgi:hypothetical protein